MAESDFQEFTTGIMHAPEVKRLPDEIAYSYPIPLKNHHVAVYGYMLIGKPPDMPKVAPPRYFLEATFPSGQVVQFRSLDPHQLGVPLPDGRTLGQVQFPSEYLLITPDEFNRREEEFQHLYSRAMIAYFQNHQLDEKSAKQVLAQLRVFGKAPLFPLFRATNPDFFSWLEANARR